MSGWQFDTLVKCECSFEIFAEVVDGEHRYRLRMKLDGLPDGFRQFVSHMFGGAEHGLEAWGSATGPAENNNYITFLSNKKFVIPSRAL